MHGVLYVPAEIVKDTFSDEISSFYQNNKNGMCTVSMRCIIQNGWDHDDGKYTIYEKWEF